MAQAIRLKFNMAGFRALRVAPGVQADLKRRADRIADAAGENVEVLPVQVPFTRAHLVIAPVTEDAAVRVAADNLLIRALEAGR